SVFFFSSRRRHTRFSRDWSSDVCSSDLCSVTLIDKHGDRPFHDTADLKHLLEYVAARILEIDDDHIGIDRIDAGEQISHLLDAGDLSIPGLAQPFLDDGGTDRALIDNDNFQKEIHAR